MNTFSVPSSAMPRVMTMGAWRRPQTEQSLPCGPRSEASSGSGRVSPFARYHSASRRSRQPFLGGHFTPHLANCSQVQPPVRDRAATMSAGDGKTGCCCFRMALARFDFAPIAGPVLKEPSRSTLFRYFSGVPLERKKEREVPRLVCLPASASSRPAHTPFGNAVWAAGRGGFLSMARLLRPIASGSSPDNRARPSGWLAGRAWRPVQDLPVLPTPATGAPQDDPASRCVGLCRIRGNPRLGRTNRHRLTYRPVVRVASGLFGKAWGAIYGAEGFPWNCRLPPSQFRRGRATTRPCNALILITDLRSTQAPPYGGRYLVGDNHGATR